MSASKKGKKKVKVTKSSRKGQRFLLCFSLLPLKKKSCVAKSISRGSKSHIGLRLKKLYFVC